MIRVPRRHPWRAFPAFDGYSDAQCRARCRIGPTRGVPGVLWWLLVFGAWIAVFVGTVFLHVLFLTWLENRGVLWAASLIDVAFGSVFLLCVLGLPILVTAFVMLGTRNVLIWFRLRALLKRARCPKCRYPLLGLTPTDSGSGPAVQCPECGREMTLSELDLTVADIAMPEPG